MELTEIDEETLQYFSTLTIEDMFPKDITYPNQSEIPDFTSSINLAKNTKCLYEFNPKPKTIHFEKDVTIYDIKTLGNILGVCGGQYLKIYNLETYELLMVFQVPNGNLFALDLYEMKPYGKIYCPIGGELPSIRVINLYDGNELFQLLGHRSDIYELKFSPTHYGILLSSSKDCTVRLWNIANGNQICIFGGPQSHLADVLSIDWHVSGEMFVSSGIDNSVKIFTINTTITTAINNSLENKPIKTILKNLPMYSCNEIHENYIDCVRFNGNFILSKSVDGVIKEWLPMFNKEGNYFFLINTYVYECHEKLWHVKFDLEVKEKIIMIGNEEGNLFMFPLEESEEVKGKDNYHFILKPSEVFDLKNHSLIRTIAYSPIYKKVFVGNDDGDLFAIDIKMKVKP